MTYNPYSSLGNGGGSYCLNQLLARHVGNLLRDESARERARREVEKLAYKKIESHGLVVWLRGIARASEQRLFLASSVVLLWYAGGRCHGEDDFSSHQTVVWR